jgi:hypothetical protein
VTLPEGGHYVIYWTYPEGATGCDGLGSAGYEPFSYAVNWWTTTQSTASEAGNKAAP